MKNKEEMMSLENGKIPAHRIVVNAVKRENLPFTYGAITHTGSLQCIESVSNLFLKF